MRRIIFLFVRVFVLFSAAIVGAKLAGAEPTYWAWIMAAVISALFTAANVLIDKDNKHGHH
jgi:hypothetical protein